MKSSTTSSLLVLIMWWSGTFASERLPPPTASISTWYTSDDGGVSDMGEISSSDDDDDVPPARPHNKPLKTLEKLQQMLDETDYMMQRKPLWTSSDRAKYKRQQRKYNNHRQQQLPTDESDEERMGYTLPDLPIYNSDAEEEDFPDETTSQQYGSYHSPPGQRPPVPPRPPLPNQRTVNNHPGPYPQPYGYNSQANDESTTSYPYRPRFVDDRNQQRPIRPPPIQQQSPPRYPSQSFDPSYYSKTEPSQGTAPGSHSSTNPPPVQSGNSPRQQQQPPSQYQSPSNQQTPPQKYFAPTAEEGYGYQSSMKAQSPQTSTRFQSYSPPAPTEKRGRSFPDIRQQYNDQYWQERYRQETVNNHAPRVERRQALAVDPLPGLGDPLHLASVPMAMEYRGRHENAAVALSGSNTETLLEAGTKLNLLSLIKWGHISVVASLLAYAAVSPRSLPLTEYNLQFYENLRILSLMVIAPAVYMASTFDPKESDLNSFTHTFFCTFSFGYLMTFVTEIIATTGLRLALFCFLEREVFALTPRIALPILPWVLKEQNYRPKRITLLAVDFLTSCVLCPILEESMKLGLLINTSNLPKNFRWKTKDSARRKRKPRKVAEAIVRRPREKDWLSANRYVSQMLAVSFAMKLCDSGRRVLLYTKAGNSNKSFYSFFRGGFPIHELCGTMTALALAKRDLLGFHIPLWKLLAPAVVVHGMANFRGKKPIFKWNSATPWSEMQLSPLHKPDASTLPQLLKKGYAKLCWVIILSRVLGYCIKNYYMVNRQAVKRTTKYAQNPAAFSAELATTELLKNQKR